MNNTIKHSIAAAVIAMVGFSSPAFAGGVQIDDNSLTDILVAKGVLSKAEAKAVKHNNDGKLKVEAELFLNTKFTKKENATATTDQTTGLNVDRAYLTGKYNFNDDWMMRVTTDVTLQSNLNSKNNNIFLKYAYVQGKLYGDAVVLRLGQSHTPWIDHEEHLWGHRYVSPVFIDKNGFDASSDLGIGLKGKLAGGLFNYWVTETAGAGYSHPGMHKDAVTGKYASGVKAFDLDSRLGINLMKGLTIDLQFRDGYKGTKYFDKAAGHNGQTTPGTKHTLYQAMITYGSGHDFRIGANVVSEQAKQRADSLNAITYRKDETTGYDLWGWGNFTSNLGAFGRFEHKKVDRTTTAGTNAVHPTTNRYVLGLEYKPVKNIAFSLVTDYSKTKDNGFTSGALSKTTTFGLFSNVKY